MLLLVYFCFLFDNKQPANNHVFTESHGAVSITKHFCKYTFKFFWSNSFCKYKVDCNSLCSAFFQGCSFCSWKPSCYSDLQMLRCYFWKLLQNPIHPIMPSTTISPWKDQLSQPPLSLCDFCNHRFNKNFPALWSAEMLLSRNCPKTPIFKPNAHKSLVKLNWPYHLPSYYPYTTPTSTEIPHHTD